MLIHFAGTINLLACGIGNLSCMCNINVSIINRIFDGAQHNKSYTDPWGLILPNMAI